MAAIKKQTQELISLINDYVAGNLSYNKLPFDDNHWFRTQFRLYIDGSYSYPRNEPGYKFVERLRQRVKESIHKNPEQQYKKFRSICIEMFLNLLEIEFDELSRSTIQKTLVKYFKPKDLELLNHHLVDDLTEALITEGI